MPSARKLRDGPVVTHTWDEGREKEYGGLVSDPVNAQLELRPSISCQSRWALHSVFVKLCSLVISEGS